MAMSAYYLKGIAPPEVQLWTIFKGCFPFLGMVFVTLALLYIQPALVSWLPERMYDQPKSTQVSPAESSNTEEAKPADGSVMDPNFLAADPVKK
jgi:hypothetical protein